jgi:hypothetical protein
MKTLFKTLFLVLILALTLQTNIVSAKPLPQLGPYSIWDDTATPAIASVSDTSAIEVGVKFQADVDGYITGIRFYKGSLNTGTHIGNLWSADTGYSSGHLAQTGAAIAGTTDDTLYQYIRWSDSANPVQYRFDLPNGNYQVRLHFNEIWSTGPGARLFDVRMEGALVWDDVDIYAQAGGQATALMLSAPVTVADGELNIEFVHQLDNPHVCAIEVLRQ